MSKQIEAVYEDGVLRPNAPLDLQPNARVRVTIENPAEEGLAGESASAKSPAGPSRSRGALRELFGSVDLGQSTGADNESIDRDLAQEYAGTHEETS